MKKKENLIELQLLRAVKGGGEGGPGKFSRQGLAHNFFQGPHGKNSDYDIDICPRT